MKKILVVACLLGMMGVSANSNFGDFADYLKAKESYYPRLHPQRACDIPESQACKIEAKKICGENKECLNDYSKVFNTDFIDLLEFFFFVKQAESVGGSKEKILNTVKDYGADNNKLLQIVKNEKTKKSRSSSLYSIEIKKEK